MGSMNNWLAFSLSHHDQRLMSEDEVSADCFGISSERNDGSYGILEAFNRSQPQPQDWAMKTLDFKGGASELSMVVGPTSNHGDMEVGKPKLEDFLGGNSMSGCNSMGNAYDNSPAYMFSADPGVSIANGNNNGNSIGLSMIKTWLRSQPGPLQQDDKVSDMVFDGGEGNPSNVQALSLSMSTGSQSSSAIPLMAAESPSSADTSKEKSASIEAPQRKSIDTFGQRTSIYRGVTRHRWTGRYEAHLWDNSCRREGQTRKGRQVYLGGYDKEEKAARAYDLAALKYWGTTTTTNFPISNYEKEVEEMKHMTRQEYVASLRRKSSGFSRGASIYRGVTRHHQHGRWQARIGRVAGNKDLYLGTFSTQEEAAEAYDIAAIKFRGLNAVTNFDMSRYDVKSIIESSALPIGSAAKRLKEGAEVNEGILQGRRNDDNLWSTIAFQQPPLAIPYPFSQQRYWCKQEQELHHLQLNSASPNIFHNIMGMESSPMDNSNASSSSFAYNGANSISVPLGFEMGEGGEVKHLGFENPLAPMDPYSGRNIYYLSQQANAGIPCNNWSQNPGQTVPQRVSSSIPSACLGAPLFSVWNDA